MYENWSRITNWKISTWLYQNQVHIQNVQYVSKYVCHDIRYTKRVCMYLRLSGNAPNMASWMGMNSTFSRILWPPRLNRICQNTWCDTPVLFIMIAPSLSHSVTTYFVYCLFPSSTRNTCEPGGVLWHCYGKCVAAFAGWGQDIHRVRICSRSRGVLVMPRYHQTSSQTAKS